MSWSAAQKLLLIPEPRAAALAGKPFHRGVRVAARAAPGSKRDAEVRAAAARVVVAAYVKAACITKSITWTVVTRENKQKKKGVRAAFKRSTLAQTQEDSSSKLPVHPQHLILVVCALDEVVKTDVIQGSVPYIHARTSSHLLTLVNISTQLNDFTVVTFFLCVQVKWRKFG